jgi:hypothetical protein
VDSSGYIERSTEPALLGECTDSSLRYFDEQLVLVFEVPLFVLFASCFDSTIHWFDGFRQWLRVLVGRKVAGGAADPFVIWQPDR